MQFENNVIMTQYLKSSDVSRITGLAPSTIRKYCQELQRQQYQFKKEGETRLFTSLDLDMIQKIVQLREKANVNLRHAVSMALTYQNQMTQTVSQENQQLPLHEIENTQHMIRRISEELMPQFQYISDTLKPIQEALLFYEKKEQEHHEMMIKIEEEMEQMRMNQEKLLEEIQKIKEKKKKKKFIGLF